MRTHKWMTTALTVAAIMMLVLGVLAPSAMAAPKPPKSWNIYEDKLGAYTVTTAVPKGQTFVAGPYVTQAEAQAILSTPPTVVPATLPTIPDGSNGWFKSNVTLSWTVTDAYNVKAGYMQVTGASYPELLISTDQQATDYTVSATSVGGTTSVTMSIKRDATPPAIQWTGSIANGDSFEVGSVPAEPTVQATDETSGVDTVGLTGYGTAIGAYSLVATAFDLAGNMAQETRGYSVFAHPANVVAPEALDETFSGTPGVALPGSVTIPAVPGVDYFLNGTLTAGGTYPKFAGTYTVTAQAQPDYALVGYPASGWTLTVLAADVTVHVSTVAPTKTDQTAGPTDGFITIPAVIGVNYLIDGNPAVVGDNPLAPGDYVVTAAPLNEFYILDGDVSWNLTIAPYVPPLTEVTPAAPSATDQTANASGFVTIPLSTGVDYALDGTAVAAGNHDVATGPHAVLATPQTGYALLGTTSWDLTVNAYVPPVQKQIEFVGRTVGDIGGQVLTLPAGWQPNDLAVAFVARNVGGTGGVPPLPAGWTNWSSGYTAGTTYPYSSYRLMYRVLQPGDTTWNTVWSYRSAGLLVYRNATPGAAVGYASRSTGTINLIIPALTLQAPGTSWVGGFGFMDDTIISENAPVAPFTVNRTAGAYLYGGRVGAWDTAGAVTTFPNTTVASGYYKATAAASFELKLVP